MKAERIAADIVDVFAQATARDWSASDHRLYEIILMRLRGLDIREGGR